ncbi:MAG TPA: hypothetical protein VGJ88_10700 [Thermoanaerobaculia bacterium]|jgi:hypothetical protein
MKIRNLSVDDVRDGRRITADIVWEDSARPSQTLFFETAYPFAADLQPSPNAFVLAALPAAVWRGERRVQIEGPLCTQFKDGLQAVMAIYSRWYPRCRPLSIEPLGGYTPTTPRPDARTACFLSGGVDGLTALRANRLDYPKGHPESVRDCILLFGANDFECTIDGPVPERLAMFREVQSRLSDLAVSEDFELIPVLTNTRLLIGDYECWTSVGFGAANVSVAHALSRRFNRVLFASDGNGVDAPPGASHPLLDQFFSTAALQVWHEHAAWSRIDKLRLLADWPPALRIMQPCHRIGVLPEGQLNCGRCEKCIRTMLGLLALGKLAEAEAFAGNDVTPEMIAAIPVLNPVKAELLRQLIEPLRGVGREDLISVLQTKTATFRRRERMRRLTPDFLRRLKRSLTAKGRSPRSDG